MKKHLILILSLIVVISFCKAQSPILWGTTQGCGKYGWGVLFKFNMSTGGLSIMHDFGQDSDGQWPYSSLIQASNGLLYGTTYQGGKYNPGNFGSGTIYSYNVITNEYAKLHDFDGNDGWEPAGSLIQANDGLLYGITIIGGKYNSGAIYSYDISSGVFTKLFDFPTRPPYQNGNNSLVQARNGLLYGLTEYGGINDKGTLFSYDISKGLETDLHDFGNDSDGTLPFSSMIQAANGVLYGMTLQGGAYGGGTIFSYNTDSNRETVLYNFDGTNGAVPYSSLIQATDSLLYGLTGAGGNSGKGVIFSYDIKTGKERKLYSFYKKTGELPKCPLLQASTGLLYGTTSEGGDFEAGTIFNYDIAGHQLSVVNDFPSSLSDLGCEPVGGLIEVDSPYITVISQLANNIWNIQLYPNPSSANIHFSLKLQSEQLVDLSLYNTLGQQVWADYLGKVRDVKMTIPIRDLDDGVYILKINAGGTVQEKEIVITK